MKPTVTKQLFPLQVETAKEKLASLEMKSKNASDQALEEETRKVRRELEEAEKMKVELQKREMRYTVMKRQGGVLGRCAEAILEMRVLKMVAFWQNVINYMVYVVLILNTFSSGLSISKGRKFY